ncbi:conserved hypothetical protein [Pediculus humanus corporis]|uniref:Nose resistant-to-fluoxetine protein N-terminal domain-containing protein n=1 Tax=Pediculus humanus subsp. corporis TaxID=121224 RepID=E0VHW3_PEDHC|nr:uncharacterized protein Phum_PHUM216760 [Pediculus humanus corporis]EEB12969.1 conserved hypothetical protein [Pediculus humanus corporis]
MAKLSSSLWIVTLTFLINLSRCEKIQNVYPAIKSFNVENYFKSETFKDLLKSGRLSELCGKHFEMWFDDLSKGDAWALQMMDSITKIMDGIFMGRMHVPGHFDECVAVRHPKVENFKGKHCLIPVGLKLNDSQAIIKAEELQMSLTYFYGICVPSTCTPKDVNEILNNLNFIDFLQFHELTENDCSTDEYRGFRYEDWIAVIVIGVLLSLAAISTIYDLVHKFTYKNENSNLFLASFSIYKNGKSLFGTSKVGNELKCIFGIRFFSISWVILGHSFITYLFSFPINFADMPKYFTDESLVLINNAYVAVDSFFFLSGCLACLVFFRDISTKGNFDVLVAYIHRYIRVTPAFAFMIFLQSTIVSRLANGPFWNRSMDKVENDCRSSWWPAILYVQNYIQPEALCLGQSWYLSADMQMFWISPFILYPLLIWPSFAPFFLILIILASSITNFTIAYVNKLQPSLSLGFTTTVLTQFRDDYIALQTRMAPYFIGIATGYVICGIQAKKIRIKMSMLVAFLGWIIAFGLCGGSLFGVIRFYFYDHTPLEGSLYLAFHRVGWALGLSWIVIACVSGYGGPINHFLSLEIFQPLAKLAYCNFLLHMTLQYIRLFSTRVNQYVRKFDAVHTFFGDFCLSFLLAIPLALLLEYPFVNLDRFFFRKIKILPFPNNNNNNNKTNYKKNSLDLNKCNECKGEFDKDVEKGKDNPSFKES